MKSTIILFLIGFMFNLSYSQGTDYELVIKDKVTNFFTSFNNLNINELKAHFADDAALVSSGTNKNGVASISRSTIDDFLTGMSKMKGVDFEERISNIKVDFIDNLAIVKMDYGFYLKGQLSHCGKNVMLINKQADDWKITHLTDTRKKDCNNGLNDDLDQLITAWHKSAAVADETVFFGSMQKDGIYLGTDATEKWTRDEMKKWSEPYFAKESAWAFTTKSRSFYFNDDKSIAWFDELLDTWMGVCRGSGVLELKNNEWKLVHYHLSNTIPNEKLDSVLELLKE